MYTLNITRTYVRVSLAESFVCGGVRDEFTYYAKISAERLDRRGFVVDVKAVMAAVQRAFAEGTFKASCEELCNGVAHTILTVAVEEGVKVEDLTVTVMNQTGNVELTWKDGDLTPKFPRKATAREKAETPAASPRAC